MVKGIKIFYPKDLIDLKKRSEMFPLIKPFEKEGDYSAEDRFTDYGLREDDFLIAESEDVADILILPMSWGYYCANDRYSEVLAWISGNSKPIWSWNPGDHGVDTPSLPSNVITYRINGYRSKQKANERGMPPFFPDPIKTFEQISKSDIPRVSSHGITIGFCGQSGGGMIKYLTDVGRVIYRNTAYKLGLRAFQPHQVMATTKLRAQQLEDLTKTDGIQTDFIINKKYRAGARTEKERQQSKTIFLKNMLSNQFTACARGGGNFSVRLYETLACGRIPYQIDTDCIYPLTEVIDWEKVCCLVRYKNRRKGPSQLKTYTEGQDVVERGRQNRKLWQDHLTLRGFFVTEFDQLNQ